MTYIKTYKCWRETCEQHKNEGRLKESELIRRHEDTGHIDHVCPFCEAVIICKTKE